MCAALPLHEGAMDDAAWVEVIQAMERIYAELVEQQTELENKNAALQESQRFVASVLRSMDDVLVVLDTDGCIVQLNHALLRLTGCQEHALLGRPLAVLLPGEHAALAERLARSTAGEEARAIEAQLLCADGGRAPVLLSSAPRLDHRQRPAGRVVTGHPIGELQRAYSELESAHRALKQAQQQLIQSEKMASLGKLVAGVAHELNNPISFVVGNIHALDRYGDKLRRYLDAVHTEVDGEEREALRSKLRIDHLMRDLPPLLEGTLEGAERVAEIVKQLRNFAAPAPRDHQQFDLVETVRNAVHWTTRACAAPVELHWSAPAELKLLNSEGHVHQIVINLVQNSLDAIAERGLAPALWLRVSATSEGAEVEVRDNGGGIDEAHLLQVFDPFFTTKPVGKGTGLGLSISYALATAQCGGKLQARNHAEGGAVFLLSLPQRPGEPE